jgi:hypothetical protein
VGEILFLQYRSTLFEEEDLKTKANRRLGPEERHNAPRAFEMRLGHDLINHAPRVCKNFTMPPVHLICAPCMQKVGAHLSFPASEMGKAYTFSSNPGRNSRYKYQPSSFKISRSELEQFKRKITLEIQESFYLLLDFLGYVFIFSNLFFGLIKFLVPINIHSFVFNPYKIKSHFLVPVTFSLSILGTKNVDEIFLQGLKMLMENFIRTKKCDFIL